MVGTRSLSSGRPLAGPVGFAHPTSAPGLCGAAEEQLAAADHAGGGGLGLGLGRGRTGAILEVGDRIAIVPKEPGTQRGTRLRRQARQRLRDIFGDTEPEQRTARSDTDFVNARTDRCDDVVTAMGAWKAPPVTPTRNHPPLPLTTHALRRQSV